MKGIGPDSTETASTIDSSAMGTSRWAGLLEQEGSSRDVGQSLHADSACHWGQDDPLAWYSENQHVGHLSQTG